MSIEEDGASVSDIAPDMLLLLSAAALAFVASSMDGWVLMGTSRPVPLLWRMLAFGVLPAAALMVGMRSRLSKTWWPAAAGVALAAMPRPVLSFMQMEGVLRDPLAALATALTGLLWLFLVCVPAAAWALGGIVSSERAPSGWYADPSGHHEQRWFDGSRWTGHAYDEGRHVLCLWHRTDTCSHEVGGHEYEGAVVGAVGSH